MSVRVMGIDLGKAVFHLIGMDEHGSMVLKERFSRPQLMQFLVNLPSCLIGMEASCGWVVLLTLIATLGGLLFGYDTAVINGAVDRLKAYFVDPRFTDLTNPKRMRPIRCWVLWFRAHSSAASSAG